MEPLLCLRTRLCEQMTRRRDEDGQTPDLLTAPAPRSPAAPAPPADPPAPRSAPVHPPAPSPRPAAWPDHPGHCRPPRGRPVCRRRPCPAVCGAGPAALLRRCTKHVTAAPAVTSTSTTAAAITNALSRDPPAELA